MFDRIDKDTLIITNNSYKEKILKDLSNDSNLQPISFMTIKEFVNNYYFTYSEKAIYYLMKKYNYRYDVCKVYLENMVYLEDKLYDSNKLNHLVNLKAELKEHGLLQYNDLFHLYLENKDIIVYNVFLDKNIKRVFEDLNARVIYDNPVSTIKKVYPFSDIKKEVRYVFHTISELLDNGVSYKNIKILKLPSEYFNEVEREAKLYGIDVNINDSTYIETELVQQFIKKLKATTLTEAIDYLKSEYDIITNKKICNIYNKIIKTCNKLVFVKEKEIFCNMFSAIMKQPFNKKSGISIINFDDYVYDDDYVFLLGFEQGNFPTVFKDEEYITYKLKKELDLYTVEEKNDLEYMREKNFLLNIKNLFITYKENGVKGECYPSNMIDDSEFVIEKVELNENKSYSQKETELLLGESLDALKKYGEKSQTLSKYYNSINTSYDTYDNRYKHISIEKLKSKINDKLSLSYTSMNDYYKCSFKYYLNYVLKINKYEESFQIFIGNLFHYILSICFIEDFDLDREYEDYLKNRQLSKKETFFAKKLKKELLFIIETIKNQQMLSDLKNCLYEEEIKIKISDNAMFVGKIDKIAYTSENDLDYISIIDYKTGSQDISLKYKDYGIGLQLPVYLYLIKESGRFKNILFTGFYLQKILNNEIRIKIGKTYEQLKKDNLKLIGYSNSNEEILKRMDRSYSQSDVIHSMKLTSNGFHHHAKVLSNEEMMDLISLVSRKIEEAASRILNADFDINPKIIDKKNIGCKYCKYKDICYLKEEDKIYINTSS